MIERWLEWEERNPAPNLTTIEDELLQLRQQFGVEMLCVVIEGEEVRQPVANPSCQECGKAMRYKGQKVRDVVSRRRFTLARVTSWSIGIMPKTICIKRRVC